MKMARLNSLMFVMVLLISFSFVACGSDDDDNDDGGGEVTEDTEAPVIDITAPADNTPFLRGVGEIEISMELTDNESLDTCIVSLSTDLKSVSGLKGIDDPVPFTPDAVGYALSGTSYEFTEENPFGTIPEDAKEGEYTLHIEVRDEAGNVSTKDVTITIATAG